MESQGQGGRDKHSPSAYWAVNEVYLARSGPLREPKQRESKKTKPNKKEMVVGTRRVESEAAPCFHTHAYMHL